MILEGPIRLKINEKLYTVSNSVPPETTLNTYIREYAHAKGTKFMCQEGGCGACIVAVKRSNPVTKEVEIFAVNSCLVLVYSCYGWGIITVEGIGNQRNGFHPTQSNLAGFSGTQCGYCSPGMVMNMFSLLNGGDKITMADVENSFGGNICRCTGYRPILDAFKALASDATPELKNTCIDIEDVMSKLKICPKTNTRCTNTCGNGNDDCDNDYQIPDESICVTFSDNSKWYRATSVGDIFNIFEMFTDNTKYMLLAGHTSHGVYRIQDPVDIYIDINSVAALQSYTIESGNLVLGANTSLSRTMKLFYSLAKQHPDQFTYLKTLADHIDLVANVPVRNMGTLAGNLSIKYDHRNFPSDIFLILEAANAKLKIVSVSGFTFDCTLQDYLELNMRQRVIVNIILPPYDPSYEFRSYKIMQRAQNTHAYVNAAFLFKLDKNDNCKVLQKPNITYGGINETFIHAQNTENYLNGKKLLDVPTIKGACKILEAELKPDSYPANASPEYRRSLAVNLLYKFILSVSPSSVSPYRSGGSLIERPLSSGKQDYQTDKSLWPATKPIPKLEAFLQCSGEAEYVYDMPSHPNELFASLVLCRSGPGDLDRIDTSAIQRMPGIVKFISAKDIPGTNTFVELQKIENEELFAEKQIKFAGQPVGVVIAKTQSIANKAANKIKTYVKNPKKPVTNFVEVAESEDQSRVFEDAKKPATQNKSDIKYKFSGSLLVGGQYHYTMETQTCYCVPGEDGIDVYPSSQWIDLIQANVAAVLALPQNCVNVSVKRVGGGYGSKLGRSALIAAACAVAANNVKAPVKMAMTMETNAEAIGKRFPMYGKYEIAINENGVIQYLDVNTYSDRGIARNEPLLGGIVLHLQNVYDASTWSIFQYDVITDHLPNTYVRAPGSTEAIAMIEYIMEHIAHVTKQDPIEVRLNNLNPQHSAIAALITDLKTNSDFDERKKIIEEYNNENRWKKRGISLVTMCYNHAIALPYHVLLSVFAWDGTVAVTHGGIEMGQGINTKVAQACAFTLGIDLNLIKVKPSNALTAPNNGPSGGSIASDAVTIAAIECSKMLLQRLEPIKQQNPDLKWKDLIAKANSAGVDLCCEYMFSPGAPPNVYNIYGVAVTEVEIDLLTGQHQVSRVDILEDVGQSMSPLVDLGQVEGAFVMGMGYWLNEKLVYDDVGNLLTNRSWNYTPPGAKDIPVDFRVYFRRNAPNTIGVLRSKASGEPPLCLSVSAVFAIRNALASARRDATGKDEWFELKLPFTPENVLLSSKTSIEQFSL